MITVYGIKNCDSVKKARKWLETNDIEYQFHDFRVDGINKNLIDGWLEKTSSALLLNKRSTSWKQLSDQQRASAEQSEADSTSNTALVSLFIETPTLIKRPVLDDGKNLMVGFKADNYENALL